MFTKDEYSIFKVVVLFIKLTAAEHFIHNSHIGKTLQIK